MGGEKRRSGRALAPLRSATPSRRPTPSATGASFDELAVGAALSEDAPTLLRENPQVFNRIPARTDPDEDSWVSDGDWVTARVEYDELCGWPHWFIPLPRDRPAVRVSRREPTGHMVRLASLRPALTPGCMAAMQPRRGPEAQACYKEWYKTVRRCSWRAARSAAVTCGR